MKESDEIPEIPTVLPTQGSKFSKMLLGGASLNSKWNANSDSPKATVPQVPPFLPGNTVSAPTLQFLPPQQNLWVDSGSGSLPSE
jgi:hypothetical protein